MIPRPTSSVRSFVRPSQSSSSGSLVNRSFDPRFPPLRSFLGRGRSRWRWVMVCLRCFLLPTHSPSRSAHSTPAPSVREPSGRKKNFNYYSSTVHALQDARRGKYFQFSSQSSSFYSAFSLSLHTRFASGCSDVAITEFPYPSRHNQPWHASGTFPSYYQRSAWSARLVLEHA